MAKGEWFAASPCSEQELQQLIESTSVALPAAYLAHMRESNGGYGDLGANPWYIQLWPAGEVLLANRDYEVETNVPGFFAFGSSGGGEMFALDLRHGQPWPVVMIPFIPMEAKYAKQVAPDFASFRALFGIRAGDAPQ
jgi:SMI1 / KNR4 family (SUKH-1)